MGEWLQERLGVGRTVLALSLARLGDGIGHSILIIVIPLYITRLPSSAFPVPESVLVGILISAFGLVTAAAQPVMGFMSDRFGRRKQLIQLGLLLMAVSTLAFVVAQRYIDLLLIRSLQGIGLALTIPASMALMTAATEKRTRGGAMGVFTTFRMLGFALGPLLGGYLVVEFGFDAAFYTGAVLTFFAMLCVQLWVEDQPVQDPEAAGGIRFLDFEHLSIGIVGLGGATFVMASAISMMSTLENQFNARLDQTALGFGIAFSAFTVSRLILQVPLGRLSDRVGRKGLIVVGLVLLAPATVVLGWVATTWQLTEARLFQGAASAAIATPAFALAADLSSEGDEGRQMSVLTMGFGLGIAIGPLLAGLLAVIEFELPFIIGGLMALAAAVVVHRIVPETVERGA